jgi:transcriptional regulator of acetoin/glycerol metabolism
MNQLNDSDTAPTTRELLEEVVRRSLTGGLLWPEVAQELEKLFLVEALRMSGASVQGAADLMGVHRNTVSRKLKELGLNRK